MDNNMITLAGTTLSLTFSAENGALVRAETRDGAWTIHRREALGLSWRLLVPVHDELRNNPVHGEKQRISRVTADEKHVRFEYDSVVSERAGELNIGVCFEAEVSEEKILWRMTLDNRSPYYVETAAMPCIGDLTAPDRGRQLYGFNYDYADCWEYSISPVFRPTEGDHSTDYPTIMALNGTQRSPYVLLHDGTRGLYVGVGDVKGEYVTWRAELRPGFDSAMEARVPACDEIAGKPVHIRFESVHMCYIAPGETRALTPVIWQAYEGSWRSGVKIYRDFRDKLVGQALPPAWARDPHSWLQIHMNSPEDELRFRFTELPEIARECKALGVKAIQLVGWNDGGQDQGNPSHEPDPRLGTFEELKQAIAECKAIGVKLILFAKFTWSDRGTDWFRRELNRYATRDPYGDYYVMRGYSYQTDAQLLDINTKRLIPMCFASKPYLEICRREFKKLVELGADGMLYDECQHHTPALLCFDTSHGHRYGWPVYQNDRELVKLFRETEGLPEDFMFAGEACYDWEHDQYELAYFRSRFEEHDPVLRMMRPRALLMTAISGFNDRNMIAQCLLYRYIMSYEPFNFKGRLSDIPETVAYGQAMDALRTEYREYLWDGEYLDREGAVVDEVMDGPMDEAVDEPMDKAVDEPMDKPMDKPMDEPMDKPMDKPMDEAMDHRIPEAQAPEEQLPKARASADPVRLPYTVYRSEAGAYAVVSANYSEEAVCIRAKLTEAGHNLTKYRILGDPELHALNEEGAFTLPAESVAVLFE